MNYNNYITFRELLSYGISEKYLKNAVKNYRQGKTKSWANKKDPNDKRKVLIDLDTIPEPTRKKYGIPTGKEHQEQKNEAKRLERIEWEAEQERQKVVRYEAQEREKQIEASDDLSVLRNAYNNGFLEYLALYKERFKNLKNCNERALLYAKQHAFWYQMLFVSGNLHRNKHNKSKTVFEYYLLLKKELHLTPEINNYAIFILRLQNLRKQLKEGLDIAEVIDDKRYLSVKKPILNDFHKSYILHYASLSECYSYRVVADLVNYHCELNNQPIISESMVKRIMATDNKFRELVNVGRFGEKNANDHLYPYLKRLPTKYPANLWMIDGTPVQFYCWNKTRTKVIRLYLFAIIDVCTRKIVGYDIAYSENRFMIMKAFQNAVKLQGHLPAEILSDNFSASKTVEIKTMQEFMKKLGCFWRYAKPENPQEKAQIERFFGVFQSVECKLHEYYIGEGVATRNKYGRPDAKFVEQEYKRKGLLSENEMKDRINQMIAKYNERNDNKLSPNDMYKALEKPYAVEMDVIKTAIMFWARTKCTIRRSMVIFKVNKVEYTYEIYDNQTKLELNGKEVYVRYNIDDMDTVMLFDSEDKVICECKKSLVVNSATVDRTDEDIKNTYAHVAKNKSLKNYIKDQKTEIHKKGLDYAGLDEMPTIIPLQLEKNQINEQESFNDLEYYRLEQGIKKEEEYKVPTEPAGYITKDGFKKKSNATYSDMVTNKKSPEKASFKEVKTNSN
ncbi:DDE-type integrase/transposase/recombinase [Flavobacterium branchiophilum]|uniref:Integrase catalytic domain-containing protein n=1 Tax=Flavobacterium branchiophilum TaxID=55197 RepID=A0A2H3KX36_9FLAO|nr:DDE-type integrase/transposase/recombinase [Flavobacterium branchiophilum]PDS23801.1 hypothetical protein B0A77_09875 [Flavobacterium branchiophilum]